MKLFLLAVCIALLVTLARADMEAARQRANQLIAECKEEIKPTDADLEPLRNKKIPNSQNGKCLLGCVLTKAGYLKDGVYQKEFVEGRVRSVYEKTPEKIDKALEELAKCDVTVTSTDKCEAGTQLYSCVRAVTNYDPKW